MPSPLPPDHPAIAAADAALNKVAKWRLVFTSWLLGSRPATDHEAAYHRDLRELLIMLRVEVSALISLNLASDAFTHQQFAEQLAAEAALLDAAFERAFPGFTTSAAGVHMSFPAAQQTMRSKGFPA